MAEHRLHELLRTLTPVRQAGEYTFVTAPAGVDVAALDALASFRETEGTTLVVEVARAQAAGLTIGFRAAWLTLRVDSQLHDVGLTAAVATALARAGIACNVMAALHHDHLFVPIESADAALAVLRVLQRGDTPAA
jgi:hypothetical protein